VVERQKAWYFGVLLHLNKMLCSAVVFRLLHQKWQVRVISLRMGPTTVKQFRCTATAYLSYLLSSSQNASNATLNSSGDRGRKGCQGKEEGFVPELQSRGGAAWARGWGHAVWGVGQPGG